MGNLPLSLWLTTVLWKCNEREGRRKEEGKGWEEMKGKKKIEGRKIKASIQIWQFPWFSGVAIIQHSYLLHKVKKLSLKTSKYYLQKWSPHLSFPYVDNYTRHWGLKALLQLPAPWLSSSFLVLPAVVLPIILQLPLSKRWCIVAHLIKQLWCIKNLFWNLLSLQCAI